MWLYLPELGRPRQVNAATRGESFLGSDFTYEDLGAPSWDERTHVLVSEPTVDGEHTYQIESRPRAVDRYARILTWVRQTSFLPLRVEYFEATGVASLRLDIVPVAGGEGLLPPTPTPVPPPTGDTVTCAVLPTASQGVVISARPLNVRAAPGTGSALIAQLTTTHAWLLNELAGQ